MGFILEKIEEAIKELLIGWIESNMTNMFTDVNEKVGTIAGEVGRTPSTWNGSIYSMIRGLSENVIVPIAGIIITFVLCYELISMITEKNNMHEMDTWMFFKWFFKAAVAIYLVTNTFDIVMAVFDIGQNVVAGAAGVIHGSTSIDIQSTLDSMRTGMEAVYTLLNIDRGVPEVWGSTYDIRDLLNATIKLRDGKPLSEMKLGFMEDIVVKGLLKKVKGTDIEKLLNEYHVF